MRYVIKLHNNIIRVIKTSGDLFLGGDDIDRLIYKKWLQEEGDIVLAKKIKTHILMKINLFCRTIEK